MEAGYLVTGVARRRKKQEGRESWRRKDERGRDGEGGKGGTKIDSDSVCLRPLEHLGADSLQISRDTPFSPSPFLFFWFFFVVVVLFPLKCHRKSGNILIAELVQLLPNMLEASRYPQHYTSLVVQACDSST